MTNSIRFGIVLSFFCLWINTHISPDYQQIIGFVVIFLFGILHGSNDIALYNKMNNENDTISLQKILIYYISIVVFGVFLFYSIPTVALLLFLLFSGYHFGEQHWSFLKVDRKSKSLILFETTYGLFILSLLFYFHQTEVKTIVQHIINNSIDFMNFSLVTIIIGIILVLSSIALAKHSINFKNNIIINLFYLLVFAIIFKTANLIWAFAIYFVVWHSVPSIKEQINYLYGNFSIKNFVSYFKSAFPYWIISLIGITILYFFFRDKELFNALFFSFLAAITFPHTIIIIKMQKKIK